MQASDFSDRSPGQLERTRFLERWGYVDGLAFMPDPLPPRVERGAVLVEFFELHESAMRAVNRLDALIASRSITEMLVNPIQLREVQASSQIENTVASLEELVEPPNNDADVRHDAILVRQNRAALEHALDSALPVCKRLLCDTHRVLMGSDQSARPGLLRDLQVYIGDRQLGFSRARFVPPPGTRVEECLREWEQFANPVETDAGSRVRFPYFVELAMLHYQLETIHPFSDGNGRLGRLMISVAPVKDKRLISPVANVSEWLETRKAEYTDRLLRVSTHGEWIEWFRFFCTAVREQAGADTERVERVIALYERYQARYKTARNGAALLKIIDMLFRCYATSIKMAAEHAEISISTAQKYVDELVRDRVLRQIGSKKRDRFFVAGELLDAIQGTGRAR